MSRQEPQAEQKDRRRRIVVRLLSLADWVERSALQLTIIRYVLLWLLRPVEARVFNHVCALADDAGLPDLPDEFGLFDGPEPSDSAIEALQTARRLRVLASMIIFLHALVQTVQTGRNAALCVYFRDHLANLTRRAGNLSLLKLRAGATTESFLRPEVRRGAPSIRLACCIC